MKRVSGTYNGSHLGHIALRPGVEVSRDLRTLVVAVGAYLRLPVNHPECMNVSINGALV